MFAALRNADADTRRGVFVIAGLYPLIFLAGAVLLRATGSGQTAVVAALLASAAVVTAAVFGLRWLAVRIFPSREMRR